MAWISWHRVWLQLLTGAIKFDLCKLTTNVSVTWSTRVQLLSNVSFTHNNINSSIDRLASKTRGTPSLCPAVNVLAHTVPRDNSFRTKHKTTHRLYTTQHFQRPTNAPDDPRINSGYLLASRPKGQYFK
jgi:hypothetical protein